ncbi:hypothetical protein BGX30_005257 [Mortierella sp. GBA39]|nr:hypothetical protein BGX30_005257 [Mortierella sp. GBA39]
MNAAQCVSAIDSEKDFTVVIHVCNEGLNSSWPYAIGLYLESLSARNIDEVDKSILRKLYSDFTVEEIATLNDSTNQQIDGKGQDQKYEPDSRSMYNEQEPFLQTLLNAIMNTTQLGTMATMRKITANMELAREFFNRINLYGVSGPPT